MYYTFKIIIITTILQTSLVPTTTINTHGGPCPQALFQGQETMSLIWPCRNRQVSFLLIASLFEFFDLNIFIYFRPSGCSTSWTGCLFSGHNSAAFWELPGFQCNRAACIHFLLCSSTSHALMEPWLAAPDGVS